ncbi:MAG TPA: ankyrin repeat domain-containing protein [Gammaproteobacteria bacterium]
MRTPVPRVGAAAPRALSAALAALVLLGPTAFAAGSPAADAARDGDLETLLALIRDGADVDAPANDGSTALLWASYASDLEMARALLAAGADPNVANDFGMTPLLQASRTGDAAMIGALLEAGADASLAHPEGATPLMAAARTGSTEAVKLLLDHGADPNAADAFQEQTPLMWAAVDGHTEVVDLLLAAGADPNRQARVSELTKRSINADFPTGGFTALMFAARNGHDEVVRRLVEAGANVNLKNGDGATAMMIAIVNDRLDLAAWLLEHGADPNDGSLYYAVEMRDATTDWYAHDGSRLRPDHPNEHSALDLIALLLEAGADPNQPFVGQLHSYSMCCDTYANASPFYRAAVAADLDALALMIEHGADLEWSPSRVADAGPGPNANVGKAPILVAMNGGQGVPPSGGPGDLRLGPPEFREPGTRDPAEAVRLLLAAGANPDAKTPDGDSALHVAVKSHRLDVIRALAEAGAALDVVDAEGRTPLQLAENPPEEPPPAAGAPPPNRGDATFDEMAGALRELMAAAGVPIEPYTPRTASADTAGDSVE